MAKEITNAFAAFEALPASPVSAAPFVREFAGVASSGALGRPPESAEALALACLRPLSPGFSPAAAAALAKRFETELEKEASPEAAKARDLVRINKATFGTLSAMKTEK